MSAVTLRIQGESDAQPNERPRLAVCRDMVQRESNQPTCDKTAAGNPDAMFYDTLMTHATSAGLCAGNGASLVLRVWLETNTCTALHPRQVGQQREIPQVTGKCFKHGSKDRLRAAHVFPSWLRSLLWHLPLRNLLLKDCALTEHIGAQTWETAVVLAPWMRIDLTHDFWFASTTFSFVMP